MEKGCQIGLLANSPFLGKKVINFCGAAFLMTALS
jgi:hypothetical protein